MVRKAAAQGGPAVATADASTAPAFEQAIGELETLVQRMESGQLSLEDALTAYRRGAELVGHCRTALSSAQQQVRMLEGELLRPFSPDDAPSGR